MCCNGTLFNSVTLMPDDMTKLGKYPQLRFKERNGQGTFGEPCVLHTGKGCSAYDDRPATCSRYVCGVLQMVAKDELTELEAVDVIKEGRALVDNVKELVPFAPGEPLAVSTWEAAPEAFSDEAKLAWERTAYHLQKYFLQTLEPEVPATDVRPVAEGGVTTGKRVERAHAPPRARASWTDAEPRGRSRPAAVVSRRRAGDEG
ncbi:MAG: hypothetical protein JNM69_21865 [Archangium sp.]|nr:hypothetical protein [Archangium sp.]